MKSIVRSLPDGDVADLVFQVMSDVPMRGRPAPSGVVDSELARRVGEHLIAKLGILSGAKPDPRQLDLFIRHEEPEDWEHA